MIALMVLVAATVYLVIGNFIVKRIPSKWGKRIAIAVLILIPTGDAIVGRIYLSYLCNTEAGVKVYQTVELPAEYWDGQGRPKFYVNQYEQNKMRYIFPNKQMIDAPQFQYTWTTKPYSQFFHIDKDVLQIADSNKGTTLGEYFLFRYWGGWIARNFDLIHNTAASCKVKDFDNWELNIFKPATSTR